MKCALFITLAVLAFSACREGDGPIGPRGNARVFVTSDPPGARLILDSRDTGLRTPDTLRRLGGRHDISAQFDTFGARYGFTARVNVMDTDSVFTIAGPLVNRCGEPVCFLSQFRYYSANRIRFASNPVGTFFLNRGSGGQGLLWPGNTNNSYVAGSMVGFAGILGGRDTVAIGIYDNGYLAGRPAPDTIQQPELFELRQTTWIVPPPGSVARPTVRGVEISQHIVASQELDDVVLLRLVFRNITHQPLYRALDPRVPSGGMIYDNVYIGFLVDPDIGVPGDDALSYEPDLDLVYAYDASFEEPSFTGGFSRMPALIGVSMLEAPPGTTVILNAWTTRGAAPGDWFAGEISERNGWLMLSGTAPYPPVHPHPRIGHLPLEPGDVRMSVTAGPLVLVPGDSAAVTIAVLVAEPVTGTFNSGTLVEPGDPVDRGRPLFSIAIGLLQKAVAARTQTASRGGTE